MKQGPHLLVILDGFGYRKEHEFNAIYQAQPHWFTMMMAHYPHALLDASGSSVGLLPHMIGNSEVGHLTIGAGRHISQPVLQISQAIERGSFFKDPLLVKRFQELAHTKKRLHLMGLLSDGGVHSYMDHLLALIELAVSSGIETIIVHPFLDGRDVAPQSAAVYLTQLEKALAAAPQGIIGTLHGRFYAMDRDKHWERTEPSYRVLTTACKPTSSSWYEALNASYAQGITDEFLVPVTLTETAHFMDGDGLVFFNFRADRARQITRALVEEQFSQFPTKPLQLSWIIPFTSYEPGLPVDVLYQKNTVPRTFFDILETHALPIFTIAETEKYAHVTYFFNGGREVIRPHEIRLLVGSKRDCASYAHCPNMSAPEITHLVLNALDSEQNRFYLINYANADMVGHSGDLAATIEAIRCLDIQLEQLYKKVVLELNGTLYVTSDHGNAEDSWDFQMNQPRTAHTTHKVPFIHVQQDLKGVQEMLPLAKLSDIAPYILKDLKLQVPQEMLKD
jgi:2,3-bisphosphoglycerate-independent phosphoglycerate mutase